MKAAGNQTTKEMAVEMFEEATNFFIRAMRSRNFVDADELLLQRYGDVFHTRVTAYCYKIGVTYHKKNGKLALSPTYEKANAKIFITLREGRYGK